MNKRPLTQLRGLFMENPFNGLVRRKSSFSPLYKPDRIFTRSAADPGPLRPLYWSGCTPCIMHVAMIPIMVNPEWASNLIRPIR